MCAALNRLVELEALSDTDLGSWAELAERALTPNPYFHPNFVVPAATLADDRVSIAVAGDWAAALPVTEARRWRRLPLPGTLAWIHDQCFLGTPLLASTDAAEALVDTLSTHGSGLFAEFDLAADSGPVFEALSAALPRAAIRFGSYERAALERRPEPTYLEGRLSGKHVRANRRLERQLADELGSELALVDRAGSAEAVDTFLALESAGWKGKAGTALAALPGGATFLHQVCEAFAARGALQLLFLEAGERIVAARLNLRAGDEIFCFKIAHDEELRKYSPGLQMELRMLEHFHADPRAARMDSCADGASEMFNRLWPDRKGLGGVLIPRGSGGRVALPALRVVAGRISANRRPEDVTAADT